MSELVNRLGGAAGVSPPPENGTRESKSRDSQPTQFSTSRSNSIPKTLHSISEMPSSNLVQTGSNWIKRVQTDSNWFKLVQTGLNWSEPVLTGINRFKLV